MSDADRVILQPACLRDLSWVAAFMRQADRDEVFALMADDNPLALAARLDLVTEQAWCAHWRGRAVAAFGATPNGPHVAEVWLFASDDWSHVALSVTRFILRRVMPDLAAAGFVRAQCQSAAGHVTAHAWLERLGAVREGIHPLRGRGGETFITFAWRRGDPAVEQFLAAATSYHSSSTTEKGA
ncbi:hypothetical protein GH722_01085 [Alphaproteobacteria bacterium HT1-32]|nr:hypothetical protein [Alphaproteobacteria bacterium HT1-32]